METSSFVTAALEVGVTIVACSPLGGDPIQTRIYPEPRAVVDEFNAIRDTYDGPADNKMAQSRLVSCYIIVTFCTLVT